MPATLGTTSTQRLDESPPRATAVPAAPLPVQLTSFVGRERELASVRRLLATTRLLTLTGAGGSGKTRLAAELAAREAPAYAGGAVWVDLAVVQTPALVPGALLAALGIHDQSSTRTPVEVGIDVLRTRPALVVLDNCEHLVTACAVLVDALLRGSPDIRVITTSREALGVAGEVAWLVPPLSLPTGDAPGDSEAVQLFVERARSVIPSFELTSANARAVVQICRRLDGLPLALELAAARLRVLPPEQLAARLDDRFRLLRTRNRAAVPRHQTLRAAIDWSYDLLDERERLLLDRVAVFGGTFSLEAAEVVCASAPIERDDVLDLLAGLVEKSLVELVDAADVARYRLLETVREYGLERLTDRSDADAFRLRHAEFFVALAGEAEPHLIAPTRPTWVARLEADIDNLRQALLWTFRADPAMHMRLAGLLGWFWYSVGLWTEGRQWHEQALSLSAEPTHDRAKVLFGVSVVASLQGDTRVSAAWLREALAIARACGDAQLEAYVNNYLGVALIQQGDPRGTESVESAIAWFKKTGDLYGLRLALLLLGTHAMQEGETVKSVTLIEEGLRVAHRFGLEREIGISLNMLGLALMLHGETGQSAVRLGESLVAFRRDPQYLFTARSIETLAALAIRTGAVEDAARLFGAAEGIRQKIGATLFGKDLERLAPLLAAMQAAAGEEALARLRADGAALSLDQAIDLGLEVSRSLAMGARSRESAAPAPGAVGSLAVERGRTEPEASEATAALAPGAGAASRSLVVRALGPVDIEVDGVPVTASAWSYAKPRELLMYLLVHPEGRSREQVGLALWPDASAAQVRNNFHVTLHHLRKALGAADWVRYEREAYRINAELRAELDAALFEAKVVAALRDARRGRDVTDALQSAITLYRGDFLEGDPTIGDWHLEMRDRLQRLYADALVALGNGLYRAGRHAEAADVFQQLLAKEPLREDAHRGLMKARAQAGERTDAMRQYKRLTALLARELETEPDRETTALYERLKRGERI